MKAIEVAREIRGLPALEALDLMRFSPKKAARIFYKTLKSAIANAEHNLDGDPAKLVVKESVAGAGLTIRRMMARARGSAHVIRKRTCHIRVVLSDEIQAPGRAARAGEKQQKVQKTETKD